MEAIYQADLSTYGTLHITENGYVLAEPSGEISADDTIRAYVEWMRQHHPQHTWVRLHSDWALTILLMREGRWEEALQRLEGFADQDSQYQDQAEKMLSAFRYALPKKSGAPPSLEGTIQIDGQPVTDALIYLWDPEDFGHSTNMLQYPTSYPDEEGVYRFYDLPDGAYEAVVYTPHADLFAGFVRQEQKQRITVAPNKTTRFTINFVPLMTVKEPKNGIVLDKDPLRFEWEAYPDAAQYSVQLHELVHKDGKLRPMNTYQIAQTESPFLELDWRTYQYQFTGVISKNSDGLTPSSVLGWFYPGGIFTWSVDAYDEHGKRIGSSRGYYPAATDVPLFRVSSEGQLDGDRYVIQQDWAKAIQAYEKERHHPNARRALAIIYGEGPGITDHGDPEKAYQYIETIEHPTDADQNLMQMLRSRMDSKRELNDKWNRSRQ
jgi:hypothetical protein